MQIYIPITNTLEDGLEQQNTGIATLGEYLEQQTEQE